MYIKLSAGIFPGTFMKNSESLSVGLIEFEISLPIFVKNDLNLSAIILGFDSILPLDKTSVIFLFGIEPVVASLRICQVFLRLFLNLNRLLV
jgi:hypothetical protein